MPQTALRCPLTAWPPVLTRSYRQNFLGISPGQRHDQRSFRIKDEDHLEFVDQPGRDRLPGAMAGIGLGNPYREEMDLPEVRDPLERSLVLPVRPCVQAMIGLTSSTP